ncbi:hypothetical protein ONS95_011574 [Cadophora gregata]|uniref:uncharacterized protein n=1 Tax=Cadophora gregata TaxID=51156 RepID=UPI0026DBD2C9|nr:uncharacterized protein ONS95_011574 [Cadophora gregata]KAK0120168.1 hypothetical protein ONS95_011574 [Cadophora gregata]KAK0121196.1 hypothetical protein ONS96_011375 [Cadophora gregata f. sp. sojae]
MDVYKVSEVVCRLYSSGNRCPRQNRFGGCPYVHNANDRRDAIAAKRAAREQAEKAKKLAAEKIKQKAQRIKQQKEYSQSKARKSSKGVKAPQTVKTVNSGVITPPASNAGDLTSKESVVQKNTLPLSPPPSPIHPGAGGFGPGSHEYHSNVSITDVHTANVSPTEASTVTNGVAPTKHVHNNNANIRFADAPVTEVYTIVNGAWHTKYTTSKEICKKHLTRRGCSFPKCRYLHDMKTRREYISALDEAAAERKALKIDSKKVMPASHVNLGTSNESKVDATYGSNGANGVVIAAKVVPPSIPSTRSPTTFWGTESGLAIWAKDNLRDRNQVKLLIAYPGLDQVPAEIMNIVRRSTNPGDGRVFELFTALPGELRNQIWGYAITDALLAGRQVHIQLQSDENESFDRITTRTNPPSLLHACSDSRSLAKLAYEEAFPHPNSPEYYYVPFNFDHDVLYIHTGGVATKLFKLVRLIGGKHTCARVNHVIVSLKEYLGDRSYNKDYWGRYMSYFRNLKSLKLMVGDGFEDLRFHKKSYCHGATHALKHHLFRRYGKNPDTTQPSVADMAPKVTFEVVPAITAHELCIDSLIYMGEGGWGTDNRGW